jgi:HPt (histidine-containing phosphotransfer) domain-containing protein
MVVLNSSKAMSPGSSASDKQQDLIQQLATEFRDSASDLLEKADDILEEGRAAGEITSDGRDSLYRVAHSLKGIAASCGYSLTGVVAHRFEDFLADLKDANAQHIADMQIFIDTLGDLVDGTIKEKGINVAEFIRKLPSRRSADFGDVAAQDIEVFVVMPDDAV